MANQNFAKTAGFRSAGHIWSSYTTLHCIWSSYTKSGKPYTTTVCKAYHFYVRFIISTKSYELLFRGSIGELL